MKRLLILTCLLILCSGCAGDPVARQHTNNRDFKDAGQWRYYVTPGPARMEFQIGGNKSAQQTGIPTSKK